MKILQIIKAYSIYQICFLFVCLFVFFRDSQICDLNKIPNYKVSCRFILGGKESGGLMLPLRLTFFLHFNGTKKTRPSTSDTLQLHVSSTWSFLLFSSR